MNTPSISTIIPAYNNAKTIRKTIDSILAQTVLPYEIIIVDDGSQDGTADVIASTYTSQQVTLIRQANQGVSVARNVGLAQASGEWVSFIDGDDRIMPTLYEHLLMRLDETKADHAVCMVKRGATHEVVAAFPCDALCVKSARALFFALLTHKDSRVHGYLVSSLFNRQRIQEHHIRLIAGLPFQEDDLFYLRYLLTIDSVALSTEALYIYESNPDSATAKHFRSTKPMSYMQPLWALRDWERFRLSCLAHRPSLKLFAAAAYHSLAAAWHRFKKD